jgi:hypothetical protein
MSKVNRNLRVRLNARDMEYLQRLAKQRKSSVTKVMEALLEDHRRRSFFEGLRTDFSALKQNHCSWEEEVDEQKLWDTAARDGLACDDRG